MMTISAPDSPSSDSIKGWESTLSGIFTDWNHEDTTLKMLSMLKCVEAAFEHSRSPFKSAQKMIACVALAKGSRMDINQWCRMLRAKKWYDVVEQLLSAQFEENDTRDGTLPVVTD
jgi:hypothetical protein